MSHILTSNPDRDMTQLKLMRCTFFQFFLEIFNFLLKLTQQCILGVLINPGLILDVFGTVGVTECTDGFIVVVICWADVCTLQNKRAIKQNYTVCTTFTEI